MNTILKETQRFRGSPGETYYICQAVHGSWECFLAINYEQKKQAIKEVISRT